MVVSVEDIRNLSPVLAPLLIEKVLPFTAHIHMGDAKGVNGEGLQIGDGEIDFDRLCKILIKGPANLSFIPEIWQGHKNHGEGFWTALSKLENKL